MALHPLAALTLGLAFFASTAVIFAVQIVAYRGAVRLENELKGQDGERLIRIVRDFLRAILVTQGLGVVVILLYVTGPEATMLPRVTLVVTGQLVAAVASVVTLNRIRTLADEPPLNGPGETVVEVQTQTTTEVKVTTSNVRATVDDGGTNDLALPAELDEGPAA